MTDFETRARAAGRAVRDAVEPMVASVEPRKPRGPLRALVVAATITTIAVIGTAVIVKTRGSHPTSMSPEVARFCTEIESSASTPSDVVTDQNGTVTRSGQRPSLEYLRDAPAEIRSVALAILAANAAGRSPTETDSQALLNWYGVACFPNAAQPGAAPDQQRYAPSPDVSNFDICSATNRPRAADTYAAAHPAYGHMTIFGDTSISDPYDAPMIGLALSSEEGFRDDETARPVTIPGHPDAVISNLTGPFGASLEHGGLVISWSDGKQTVGVFGRGYGPEREGELIALAHRVTVDGSGPHLPSADVPESYKTVFDGPLVALNTLGPSVATDSTYAITANRGELQFGATIGSAPASEAIRFLGSQLRPVTVHGVRMLAGPWASTSTPSANSTPPAMLRWREPNGVTFTLVSIGHRPDQTPSLDQLKELAASVRRLNRSEWERVIRESDGCYGDLVGSRSAASSSGSGSSPAPGATTTTVPSISTAPPP
ncbi:MAG: hypothetical protein JJE46_04545 [Acidimicrobiia bacterium]|nr:hypothetical protein [Acidimicrobiia bacterium]